MSEQMAGCSNHSMPFKLIRQPPLRRRQSAGTVIGILDLNLRSGSLTESRLNNAIKKSQASILKDIQMGVHVILRKNGTISCDEKYSSCAQMTHANMPPAQPKLIRDETC